MLYSSQTLKKRPLDEFLNYGTLSNVYMRESVLEPGNPKSSKDQANVTANEIAHHLLLSDKSDQNDSGFLNITDLDSAIKPLKSREATGNLEWIPIHLGPLALNWLPPFNSCSTNNTLPKLWIQVKVLHAPGKPRDNKKSYRLVSLLYRLKTWKSPLTKPIKGDFENGDRFFPYSIRSFSATLYWWGPRSPKCTFADKLRAVQIFSFHTYSLYTFFN